MKPVLGIGLGDPAGVGPELIAKIAADGFLGRECAPLLLGDGRVLSAGMRAAGVSFPVREITRSEDFEPERGITILRAGEIDPADYSVGRVDVVCGKAVAEVFLKAIELLEKGAIAGFAYAPANKEALKKAGFAFQDELSFFAHHMKYDGRYGEVNVVEGVMTSRVTSHIPHRDVGPSLTAAKILESIRFLNATAAGSGIVGPRLAVAALNPHCGEGGLCGREEIEVIAPAVEEARREGIAVEGPLSADTVFSRAFRGDFDAVVTMYHDQGQIALKLREFAQGVTVLGGLPFPVVTVGHGTAFDIAGKNIAKTDAMRNAVSMASRMARAAR